MVPYYVLCMYKNVLSIHLPYIDCIVILFLYLLHASLCSLYIVSTYFIYICMYIYILCMFFYILHRYVCILLDVHLITISLQHVFAQILYIYIYNITLHIYIYAYWYRYMLPARCIPTIFPRFSDSHLVFKGFEPVHRFRGAAPATSLDHKALGALCAKLQLEEPRLLGWFLLRNQTHKN